MGSLCVWAGGFPRVGAMETSMGPLSLACPMGSENRLLG
jgi:hypothetical protein